MVPSATSHTARRGRHRARMQPYDGIVGDEPSTPIRCVRSDGSKLASVERAEIQADGSLGAFTAVDAALIQARSGHTGRAIGGRPVRHRRRRNRWHVDRAASSARPSMATARSERSRHQYRPHRPEQRHRSAVVGGGALRAGGSTSGGISPRRGMRANRRDAKLGPSRRYPRRRSVRSHRAI